MAIYYRGRIDWKSVWDEERVLNYLKSWRSANDVKDLLLPGPLYWSVYSEPVRVRLNKLEKEGRIESKRGLHQTKFYRVVREEE